MNSSAVFRLSIGLFVWSSLLGIVLAADKTPPNVVIILADDLGFSDLGCYGGEIETPNLDQLAARGLKFTQFYNTARCWPTRAGIMTGYYAQQVRRDSLPQLPSAGGGANRPAWARLLPEMLRNIGYRNYHSGKWHIDGLPLKNGFDHAYTLDDHNRFFSPQFHTEDDKPLPPVELGSGYYATTAIADHCLKCLSEHALEHASKPFFHYLCFTSPHFPLHALPEDIAKYKDRYTEGWDVIRARRFARQRELGLLSCELAPRAEKTSPPWNPPESELRERIGPGEIGRAVAWTDLTEEQKRFQADKMAIHAAMVDRMDREVGRVIDQLRAMDVLENTLIFFLSDNGASAEQLIRGDGHDPAVPAGSAKSFLGLGPGWSTVSNAPFRMHKSWVHEGGIATPLIVHWPQGLTTTGELRGTASHLIDLVPTILEVTGANRFETWNGDPVPAPPGKSLVPALARDVGVPHDFLWWYHSGNRAIRIGDWKLVSWGEQGPWELFDLNADRSETHNLAAELPGKVRQMEQAWKSKLEEFQELAKRDLPKDAKD
ncbi:arylsulfatase [Schlesneria paludicola]|uniref:arylsulfatase n=1 Tax=Schlesneria paludicola TaxID=360056 RepID=UPI00029A31BE|nr:arylsulfatase [Schlesneria paludicola]